MELQARLRIGEVAQRAQIGVETVRFYEKAGLLPAPPRKPSGYRQYPLETVTRIRFVQAAKRIGFTLKEVRELLSLRVSKRRTCSAVRERASAKIADVDARIAELQRVRSALVHLATTCGSSGHVTACPFLEALERGGADAR